MELTLDEALQKGIEAHKAGQIQEADRFYTAILKAQPKHADANHNLGVLAVSVGKIQEALTLFKTALEANSSKDQFWLSYIDALIKVEQITEAKAVLDQAKAKGVHGEAFDQLEKRTCETSLDETKKQDPPLNQLHPIMTLYTKGQLQQALSQSTKVLKEFPDSAILYNIAGASNAGLMRFDAAVDCYKTAVSINPRYPDAYNNMGIALKEKGNLKAAIDCYNKAVSIKPDYAEAYNNMGISLNDKGDPKAAISSYKKAISIKRNYAIAYNNMGMALDKKGDLDAAVDSYKQALKIKPDYAEAYNNMGNSLNKKGDLDEALSSHKQALKIKPDFVEAAWNLSGLAANISESKSWIEHCLQSDQNHVKAKLTLSALRFYQGDKTDFNDLSRSSLKGHPYMRSFAWAFGLPELPALYFHMWALFDYVIGQSKKDRPFYEFGVFRGGSFQYLINTFKRGYGFDTFEGLPEAWHSENAGAYSSDGNIPQIEGGEFFVGKFDDTLPAFFSEPHPMASVINFDADLYSSTICALTYAKSVIDQHTILIFDEFIMNNNWEQDEYRALNEFCLQNSYTYEVLAISFFTKQVAVRLVRI